MKRIVLEKKNNYTYILQPLSQKYFNLSLSNNIWKTD